MGPFFTLKYINDVLYHTEKQQFIYNLRNDVFISLNWQKVKISLRSSTHTFISMSHTCRWRSIPCCLDIHWQLCALLRKSRDTTCCSKAEFHKAHLIFMEEYKYTHMISLFVYSGLCVTIPVAICCH